MTNLPFGTYVFFLLSTIFLLPENSDAYSIPRTKPFAKIKPVDEAVAIFGKVYPYGRPPVISSARVRFGMPITDFDGTRLQKQKYTGKRLVDITESQARASFTELARNYGTTVALGMVQDMPICLSFKKENFKPSLSAFSNVFGRDEAIAMVRRNPGLLALKPANAATVTDQTMVFSYLVGYTRPVGPLFLSLLALALLTLPLEAVTGIKVSAELAKLFQ